MPRWGGMPPIGTWVARATDVPQAQLAYTHANPTAEPRPAPFA